MHICSKFTLLNICSQSLKRFISNTPTLNGKHNFRKFMVYNKRSSRALKGAQSTQKNPPILINRRGVRDTGIFISDKFTEINEMIPDVIVPDLKDCKLKPYVSYRTAAVIQSEFTSADLFNAIYSKKILNDFAENKLNDDGSSKEPTSNELITPEEAALMARKTGSDIF